LLPPRRDTTGFAVTAIRANAASPASIQVTAIGSRGETLSDATLPFKAGQDRGGACESRRDARQAGTTP